MRIAILVLAFAACAKPAPIAKPAAPSNVAEMLDVEVGAGRSVAIVGGEKGLRAISSDGAREKTLVPDPVWFALVDNHANVVWYGVGAELRAIDLEAPAIAPILVVENIVTGSGYMTDYNIGVKYPGAKVQLDTVGIADTMWLSLVTPETPAFIGQLGNDQNEGFVERVARAKLVGIDFARTIATRPDRSPKQVIAEKIGVPVDEMKTCEVYSDCGRGWTLPGTQFGRVVVGYSMGDVPHAQYRLYDVKRNVFLPGAWFDTLTVTSVAPDHSAFVADGQIVRIADGTAVPATPKRSQGGGFLRGQAF